MLKMKTEESKTYNGLEQSVDIGVWIHSFSLLYSQGEAPPQIAFIPTASQVFDTVPSLRVIP